MSKLQGLINQLYPNGVEFKTMGEICDFIRGPFGGSLKKECFVNNGYAVYEQQNAIYNKLEFRYFIDENKYNELKRFIIHSNDLIVSCSGTIGKVMIIPNNAPKGIINQALLKLTPHRNINSKYLKYLFENSIETILNDCSRGGAIKNVPSVSELKKIKIPVPPIEVQTKIANFLSLIDRKIELQEKLVENLNLYKKGLLKKVFSNNLGWKTQKLGDICDTITKGTTPFNFESSGVNFIRVECINNFEIDIKKCLYISNKTHINDLKRSILKENDLLFAIAGSIGKCGIVKKEYLPCNTNQALAIIRLKKNQNPYYILLIINSSKMKKYIYENISIGAQPNLNLEQIGNFEIPIPPIEEQNKIANLFTSLDKKIELETKKLQDLKTYKKGLLQKMFI